MRGLCAIVGIIGLLLTESASAHYVQTMKVRYRTSMGPSEWYSVDVNFETGPELNTATRTISYDALGSLYAVIFWGEHEASVIKSDQYAYCSYEATQECLPRFQDFKGVDQEGRAWEVCTTTFCS